MSGVVELSMPLVEPDSILYFISGIICMLLTAWLTLLFSRKSVRTLDTIYLRPLNRWKSIWIILLILGLAGGLFVIVNYTSFIDYRNLDFVAIRQTFYQQEPTLSAYMSNMLSPFSLMLFGLTILLFEELGLLKSLLGLIVGAGVPVILSVGLAGRAAIFDILVLCIWWLLQRPVLGKKILPKHKLLLFVIIVIIIVAFWLILSISIIRSPQGSARYAEVLGYSKSMVLVSPNLDELAYKINPLFAAGLSEALTYWTSPIAAFDKLYKHWGLAPDYMSALSPVLSRRLVLIGAPSFAEIAEHQSAILLLYGIWPNIFLTATFRLIVSFGKIGAFIAQIVLAVIASCIYVRARRRPSFTYMYLSSLLYLMLFLWFQGILTLYPLHEYGFYWCILFLFLKHIKPNRKIRP